MSTAERIIQLRPEDLNWPFESQPQFSTRPKRGYARSIKVDPFPCYPHNPALVRETAERVEAAFPIGAPPNYYLSAFDTPERTNGYADRDWIWLENDKREWEPYIVLIGKRIPLHPAMTRYLVAHEYGHVVQWWIEHVRGIKDDVTTELDREYMALRPNSHNDYGGGLWHANIGELFANDFRICVTGMEPEFWPHPGFPHPTEVPAIQEFWAKAVTEYAHKSN